MIKSRLYLKNLARAALNSLELIQVLIISLFLFYGCSSSTSPSFTREDINQTIQDICKKEFNLDVTSKLIEQTLWVYLPVENILVKSSDPKKNIEKFAFEPHGTTLNNGIIESSFSIKPITERETLQEDEIDKAIIEKISNVWGVIRRVIFSMERSKGKEPEFLCLVTADIKNAIEITTTSYTLDLKKIFYGLISWEEYQHRTIQDININPMVIGDKEGISLDYKEIKLNDFIITQIEHRIKMKFQKPEVDIDADIDKEIIKLAIHTIKTYNFKDFTEITFNNLVSNNKTTLNQAAVWRKANEQKH